jgi:hypothetical protein
MKAAMVREREIMSRRFSVDIAWFLSIDGVDGHPNGPGASCGVHAHTSIDPHRLRRDKWYQIKRIFATFQPGREPMDSLRE